MATILIVDDRPANRELLVTLLGYAGHRLLEASEGEAGLVIARAEHPDLIITDIVMPRMDGYEFARQVRSDPSIATTQIIFVTASYIIKETRRLADACGVSIVISKPIEPQAFLDQVNQVLVTQQRPVINTVTEDFHQEHMRHLTDALATKVEELEAEIAERKRAEEALRRNEERYRGIFDAAPVSIWLEEWTEVIASVRGLRSAGVTDFHQYYADHPEFVQNALQQVRILDINDETLAMFKATAKDEMLASLEVVFATDDTLPEFIGELVALGEDQHIYRTEMALRTVRGDLIHVLLTMTFPFEDTSSGDVLVSLMDITHRRQAEFEIRRLNSELEERVVQRTLQLESANKELEAFSYSVSHDLRSPLRSIDGFSQALLEDFADQLPAEGQNHLKRVRAASQRMGQLIDALLNLSMVTRALMKSSSVDLSELAQVIIAELQRTHPERKVNFKITPNLKAYGDPGLLQAVLENLLNNAWKFTSKQEQAVIEFGSKDENDETIYFIRDNGAGFDMAYAGKLFGAFQRLHSMTEFSGTGIGLATVQRIINRHGGRIWAEGAVDQGATFLFTLPALDRAKPGTQPREIESLAGRVKEII